MKKLLVASIAALMLAACSSSSAPQEEAQAAPQGSASVEAALQECRQTVGETADRAAFDACMKSKGFERPAAGAQAEQPVPAAPAPKM
jgi:uncharacterized protein YcfL